MKKVREYVLSKKVLSTTNKNFITIHIIAQVLTKTILSILLRENIHFTDYKKCNIVEFYIYKH